MKDKKSLQRMGALALIFCFIISTLLALPISAARTETPLPLCPYIEGEHYYAFSWYYDNGIITPDTLLRFVALEEIYIEFVEYSEWEGDVYDEETDDYYTTIIKEWLGFGSCTVMPFDTVAPARELQSVVETYLTSGDNYASGNPDNWECQSLYLYTDMQIYIVDETIDEAAGNPHIMLFVDTFKGLGASLKNSFNDFVFDSDGTVTEECKTALVYLGIAVGISTTSILFKQIFRRKRSGI